MTILGTGLFMANSLQTSGGVNNAPSLAPVTLHFELMINRAPVGAGQAMQFEVEAA